jgi:hypothetical protein
MRKLPLASFTTVASVLICNEAYGHGNLGNGWQFFSAVFLVVLGMALLTTLTLHLFRCRGRTNLIVGSVLIAGLSLLTVIYMFIGQYDHTIKEALGSIAAGLGVLVFLEMFYVPCWFVTNWLFMRRVRNIKRSSDEGKVD